MPIYALGDRTPTIHPDAYIHPEAVIIGSVTIGAQSSIWPGAVLRGDDGEIIIGERTSIQDGSVLHTTHVFPTVVGNDCVIGHIVHLEGCTIEDGSLIVIPPQPLIKRAFKNCCRFRLQLEIANLDFYCVVCIRFR